MTEFSLRGEMVDQRDCDISENVVNTWLIPPVCTHIRVAQLYRVKNGKKNMTVTCTSLHSLFTADPFGSQLKFPG
jgi:hypothetical protein